MVMALMSLATFANKNYNEEMVSISNIMVSASQQDVKNVPAKDCKKACDNKCKKAAGECKKAAGECKKVAGECKKACDTKCKKAAGECKKADGECKKACDKKCKK
ncbi:MAG: hypothetical protein PUD32_06035 [Bacteroidales bacterium]|nr:hypothetical protein [Bacteroidales bacterium]